MNIQDIINNIAAGENLVAREGLENALSAKAFDALQDRKQEIASALYAGPEQESEEDTDYEEDEEEVTYAEGVEHDGDQLDEVSKETLQSYHTKAIKRRDEHESGRDVKVYKVGANTKGLARAKNRGVGKGPYE
jgi:O-acetyl-ADP-ribose deacetylase (regulator of RNase III)